MASNPNPARITDQLWYLWEQLLLLEPKSKLGGIYAFKSGYHSTRTDNKQNWPGNYSIVDSEDQGGPSDKAGAIDWTFPDAQSGRYETIMKYSDRLMASGKDPQDDRLNGWREFYGQCDEDTYVEGYDFRYHHTATSDPSHLWHIHLSCDRDKVTSKENMDKLLSVLRGEAMAHDPLDKADVVKIYSEDNIIKSQVEAGDDPVADKDYITAKTAIERTRVKLETINNKIDDLPANTVIIDEALLKQVMLDPVVVETYAKAVADQIVGLRYEKVE